MKGNVASPFVSNPRSTRLNPQKLLSYKVHVMRGANPWAMKSSIVYFHGTPKPHARPSENNINREWRQ